MYTFGDAGQPARRCWGAGPAKRAAQTCCVPSCSPQLLTYLDRLYRIRVGYKLATHSWSDTVADFEQHFELVSDTAGGRTLSTWQSHDNATEAALIRLDSKLALFSISEPRIEDAIKSHKGPWMWLGLVTEGSAKIPTGDYKITIRQKQPGSLKYTVYDPNDRSFRFEGFSADTKELTGSIQLKKDHNVEIHAVPQFGPWEAVIAPK